MKSKRLNLALSIIVAGVGYSSFAFAQVTLDVSKITCKQFALREVAKPRSVAIWLSGYYAGKRDVTTLDIQALEKKQKEIELFCRKVDNLELPLNAGRRESTGSGPITCRPRKFTFVIPAADHGRIISLVRSAAMPYILGSIGCWTRGASVS